MAKVRKLTQKGHARLDAQMIAYAAKIQAYCEEHSGYCNCGYDGRACVFWVKTGKDDSDDGICRLGIEPSLWFDDADTVIRTGKDVE